MTDEPFMGDFPDRPTHPDFWKLSDLVLQHDGKTEDRDFDIAAHIAAIIDPESLAYLRRLRVQRALEVNTRSPRPNSPQVMGESLWLDAFMLGVAFGRRYGET